MGKISKAFMSNDPKIMELRSEMFCQAGVVSIEGEATVEGQMVPSTGFPKYLVDDIVKLLAVLTPFYNHQHSHKIYSNKHETEN